ncbi:hypothetical protein PIN31115_04415 [Pandoraea iniqua]|uniref:Erythromycin biosynthesis protein CIII-like C-terminal domain-containing protein n=1 Tax=Pandoraea iniqua TaxID=2508288 RepID=A0A5E4YDD7_9BURK|nr:nucleotide disphospho-sugar-binding domain-containing protein [Pandoraea iniqua]VVE46462.1 hypothetical protein PIN31115_04415 [Pandoraea iniqua]
MARIIIAWELGGNLGHLWSLLPVALQLRSRGHDVVFGLRAVDAAQRYLAPHGFRWFAAPVARDTPPLGRDVGSYIDILAACGADQVEHLQGMVGAWQHLYAVLQSNLVILEHSPFALLAAKQVGLPTLHLGTGFTIPPTLSPAPCFRPWDVGGQAARMQTQATVEQAVQSLFEKTLSLTEHFCADQTCLLSVTELDHYGAIRQPGSCFVGPLPSIPLGDLVKWTSSRELRILVYLRTQPWTRAVLRALDAAGAEVIAVIPDAVPELAEGFSNIRLYREPVGLDAILECCDLVVAHGGHGMALGALLCGVPMLLLPLHLEQLLVTQGLVDIGAGIGILPVNVLSHFEGAVRELLLQLRYRNAARSIATRYKALSKAQALTKIVGIAEGLITS